MSLVIDADRLSTERFSGHGSALAQPYNHMIMPLANQRDKYTQVRWGIRDFERRYRPSPGGDVAAGNGGGSRDAGDPGRARHQVHGALAVSGAAGAAEAAVAGRDVTGGRIDPTMPYRLRLPSRRKITIFFYDGPISRAVAFERLLDKGEYLAGRLMGAFSDARPWPQLAHIATDGETYGHHHPLGDMALSYALKYIEENGLARLTNYGEFLEQHPPSHEVQIYENTAWSCAHGVERWRSSCGCNSGGRPEWKQDWRLPLREALDWLRDSVAPYYEAKGREYLNDPWAARDDYIKVILDRRPENRERFFAQHAAHPLSGADEIAALKLLELQRHAMLMYTSCGWFFDELSGIETVQVIQYAGRVLQLAKELGGPDLELPFLDRLECARSNIPEHRNGRVIFEKFVRPAMVDLEKVGAHYAIASIFENGLQQGRIYSYSVDCQDSRLLTAGKTQFSLGKLKVTSEVTQESAVVTFGVAHLGDQTVAGGVRSYVGETPYLETLERMTAVFRQGDFPELIRAVDREFGPGAYSLKLLFRDEQRKILRQILAASLAEAESAYRHIYESHVGLARLLASIGMPAPKSLEIAAEVTLNNDLRRAFEQEELDLGRIAALVEEAQIAKVPFDAATLEFSLRHTLERMAEQFAADPEDAVLLEKLEAAAGMTRALPFGVVLWRVQNIYYDLMLTVLPLFAAKAVSDRGARAWVQQFRSLGERLGVRVD